MMIDQCSVSEILNRLSHYVSAISHTLIFKGRSLSKILYLD